MQNEEVSTDVPAKVSISNKLTVESKLTFDLDNGAVSMIYNGEKVEINALDLSPLYTNKDLLKAQSYLEFYDKLAAKDKDGKWEAISALYKPIIEKDAASKHSILEYMTGDDGAEEVQYVLISVKPEDEAALLANLWKIVNKDYTADNFDMAKDVKILGDKFPFNVALKVGGAKETSENMNLSADGKLTIEGTDGSKTLVASAPSYIQDCKLTWNDPNQDKTISQKPECCVHFTTVNKENEYICSSSELFCKWEILAVIKKLKLACDKYPLKNLKQTLELPNLYMVSEKPVDKNYPFFNSPTGKGANGQTLVSPQGEFDSLFAYKDEFLNLADDEVTFTLLTETEFKKAGTTLAESSEGDTPSENPFNPTFLKIETIGFKNGKITIEFKDSEKKYIRNLANVRLYNHEDPAPQDDVNEEVQGAIYDALNFYNYMKNRVYHSDLAKLQKFKSVMFRILGSNGLYNKGKKCDIIEFENPMNTKQEIAFLCYCNHSEGRANCKFVNYNNALFNNQFTNQVRNAYYNANMAVDLRLLRNSDQYKVKFWTSKVPAVNEAATVSFDDTGVLNVETKKHLFNFKDIDDDPENKDNKCLLYYNNYEFVKYFKPWHKETGSKRECCFRWTTDKQQVENYLCVSGVMCTAWTRMLVKKTKVYCVDAKVSPVPHDKPVKDLKFLTEPAGIADSNYSHYDLNYASGLNDTRNKTSITIAVKGFDLTSNKLYNSSEFEDEVKSGSMRHFYHPEFYRFKEKSSTNTNTNADKSKLTTKTMFLVISDTHVRLFDNPSDEKNHWKLAQMQFMCADMLLCTLDAFKKTTVKTLLKKKLEELQPNIDPAIAPQCKVLYFLNAQEAKRKIFVVCPMGKSNEDLLEKKFIKVFQKYLKNLRLDIPVMQKTIPYALNTYPFRITAHSPSVLEEEPIEVKFKPQGIFRVSDDTALMHFDESTCQVVIGLEDECCTKSYVKNGESIEELQMCTHSKSSEHCQLYAMTLAKKIAVDCTRFKDKKNDIQSITDVNNDLIGELMVKRENIEEVDGNRYEAFSKSPIDLRLPIQILSRENAPVIMADAEDLNAVMEGEAEELTATDISKGQFGAKGFLSELGSQAPKDKVDISVDSTDLTLGEDISEKFSNMVWPCKESINLCKPAEFFETKGFSKTFLAAKKTEFEEFKSAVHVTSDEFCVILAFWGNRIVPVCLKDEKDVADLNAVSIKNYEKVMAYKKFIIMELNKKPNDVYEFPIKVYKEKVLSEESIKPLQQGIAKVDGTVLFEYAKIQDNCGMHYRFKKELLPEAMGAVDYKCCVNFSYEGLTDKVYMCMNSQYRCQVTLKWFLKNTYFYCTTKTDYASFEPQGIDPSLAIVPDEPAPPKADEAARNVDVAAMMDMRKNDWAFHFFKQNEGTKIGNILPPSKCDKVDNVTYFSYVKGWWFDNKMGTSMTGSAPSFLRIIDDDICMCPQCREGFDKANYKDDMCTCWKVHNMVFKCSTKYEICTYEQFDTELSKYKEYIKEKMLVENAIKTDESELKKEHCVFVQFQVNFRFKEMFLCPYGEKAEEYSSKIKTVLNSSYPKMVGESDVHFERPMLADNAISFVKMYDKSSKNVTFNGKVKFDKSALVDGTDETAASPKELLKYADIKDCKIEYLNQTFPDATNFEDVPYPYCCFSYTLKNDSQYYMCHKDPYACIVPSRRIMYKLRSKCKADFGMTIKEYFNYTVSDYVKGFWRGWAYVVESQQFADPTKVPKYVSPEYVEVDKKRELRLLGNVVQFLKDEEVGKPTDQYVKKVLSFKYMDYFSGLYHALSPKEYITWYNNKTQAINDPAQLEECKTRLDLVGAMLKKVEEFYHKTENCLVMEWVEFDVNTNRSILMLCPYINSSDNMFRFKWANTIAYNYNLINSLEYSFPPAQYEKKLQLVWRNESGSVVEPTWVQIKKDTNVVSKVEGDEAVLDVFTIKDQSPEKMCAFQVSQVDIPDEILTAGFKFESYCCVKFNTEGAGFMTMCNVNKPRCWYDLRTFARLMRKICLKDHLTKAGLPVDAGLAKEKYGGDGALPAADATESGEEINEYKDVYEIKSDSLVTMGAAKLVSEKDTATTVLRKIEVKQVDNKWMMILDDKPPAAAAADPAAPAVAAPAAPAAAGDINLQELEVKNIKIINLYYECADKPDLCGIKAWLKKIGKRVPPTTLEKIQAMVTGFKSSIKNEKLNPKIYDVAFVVQARENATHTTKTYLLTVADHTKAKEVLSFLNEKFKLAQTGPIREKIWTNKSAPAIDEGEYPETVFFKTKNNVATNVKSDKANITNWGVKEKDSGKIFFSYSDVTATDNNCMIAFNFDQDFSTSIDNVDGSCCINITTEKDSLHMCSTAVFRCQYYANKMVKTMMRNCNNYKLAEQALAAYRKNNPVVTYDYLAYDQGTLLKDQFYKRMSLPFEDSTDSGASSFMGYAYVVDFKDQKMRPSVARMYVSLGSDSFEMYYTKDSKYNLVRHEMKAYRPFCEIACNGEQYYEELLSKTPAAQKKIGIQELNFLKKQIENSYEVVKGFDKLAANKLLTAGLDSCAVLNFEDIGTYVGYSYYVCTNEMEKLKGVLKNNFVNKVKESSAQPLKIKLFFNPWFMRTDPVYMKVQKVSREVKFDIDGIYYGEGADKSYVINYKQLNRGPRDEPCPIWYLNVEKHLALENGTSDPACCFKMVSANSIKTICMDSDTYSDKCQYYKMRSVVTIKNHCLKRLEDFNRSGDANGGAGKKAGGFNPLSPTISGGFLGDIHLGKFYDTINLYDPTVLKRLTSTSNEVKFAYEFQGKSKDKVLSTSNLEVYNFEEVQQQFTSAQQTDIDKQTSSILNKMNSVRTTPDKPVLKTEDCLLLRYLNPKDLNYENWLLCPNDPYNSHIMETGLKNSIYVKLRDTKLPKDMPESAEGDTFNITVVGASNGEAKIEDQALVWSNNGQPVVKPSDIDKVRGKACAAWFVDMYVESKFDGNCCFAFMSGKAQKILCETSSFCITKAKKLMKFVISACHNNSSLDGQFGFKPHHIPALPFYKNEETKNYGWDEYLGKKEEEEHTEHVDNVHKAEEIPKNGIIPPPFDENLSDAQREAFRAVVPEDKTLIDRHREGYWRGLVWYYQLEDLDIDIRSETKNILEINDRTITLRNTIESHEYLESTMTSMWKIDCKASLYPCSANGFLEEVKDAKDKLQDKKISEYVTAIKTNWKYKVEDCVVIRFWSSQLSAKKKDTKDNVTTSLVCPYRLDQTHNIQKAVLHAFNRAMYLINPTQDLPEVEDKAAFSVDVYRGGDKLAESTIAFGDKTVDIDGSQKFAFPYENVLQCKILYVLRRDELPDPTYKNKVKGEFYVENETVQEDCCIFFKLIDDVKVKGKSNAVLNNMYICSRDKDRCMYNVLLAAKEIYSGCEETVNKEVMNGVMNNPAFVNESNKLKMNATENKNPVGYRWDDEEGWVNIEDSDDSEGATGSNDFNFCADAMRFRKGGYKKFLHGEINQVCL